MKEGVSWFIQNISLCMWICYSRELLANWSVKQYYSKVKHLPTDHTIIGNGLPVHGDAHAKSHLLYDSSGHCVILHDVNLIQNVAFVIWGGRVSRHLRYREQLLHYFPCDFFSFAGKISKFIEMEEVAQISKRWRVSSFSTEGYRYHPQVFT